MSDGYHSWTQSPFGRAWRLDDTDLDTLGVLPFDKEPSEPRVPIPMGDGRTAIQGIWRGQGEASIGGAYRWPFTIQARSEDESYKLRALAKTPRAVGFIDWEYEVEVFVAGDSLTSFILPRSTASSQWGSFPTSEYPTKAFLNGTEQTVVATAPSAGEVQIVGADVTTPTLNVNDILEIRYIPWYTVVVGQISRSLARFNDYVLTGEILEVGP